jgi:uncharacterized membrane protein YbhN (UPF0104 family)
VVAAAIAVIAVLAVARVTGVRAVGRAFTHFDARWIALIGGAEIVAYAAYVVAYRSIGRVHGRRLPLPVVARAVVAGFGSLAVGGGFAIDKRVLEALEQDERTARVQVLGLGALEWAVLAPTTCAVAIVSLVEKANIASSLLWPWASAVPLGFTFGLWASAPQRAERMSRIRGKRRESIAQILEGIGVLRTLISCPLRYIGAWSGTALYWAADMCALYGGLRTFGLDPGVGRLVLAYATGYAATRRSLPLGGAGVTEVLMTYSLYWVREPLAPALAAVVAYRAFNLLLAATPALIAHRQLEPLLDAADELEPARQDSR